MISHCRFSIFLGFEYKFNWSVVCSHMSGMSVRPQFLFIVSIISRNELKDNHLPKIIASRSTCKQRLPYSYLNCSVCQRLSNSWQGNLTSKRLLSPITAGPASETCRKSLSTEITIEFLLYCWASISPPRHERKLIAEWSQVVIGVCRRRQADPLKYASLACTSTEATSVRQARNTEREN